MRTNRRTSNRLRTAWLLWACWALAAPAQWVAYNDHYQGAGSSPNATFWNVFINAANAPGNSGFLRNITTGDNLPVTLTITNRGCTGGNASGAPTNGTPAYNFFHGFVDFGAGGTTNHAVLISGSAVMAMVFSNLNPAARYSFRGTAVRGGTAPAFSGQWTLCRLDGADTFLAAHSSTNVWTLQTSGSGLAANEAAFNSGRNLAEGDCVGWDGIDPGSDGMIVVYSLQYTSAPVASGGIRGFGLVAIRLEESALCLAPQPQGGRFCAGAPVNLTVGVIGQQPWSFQWWKDGASLVDATNQSYRISSFGAEDAGGYSVVVSNASGAVTSTVAQLTLFTNAVVVTSPPTNTACFAGSNTTLKVEVSADSLPVTVQWYWNSVSNTVGGSPVNGATNLQLVLSNASISEAGFYYAVLGNCNSQVTTDPVFLAVPAWNLAETYAFTNLAGSPGSSGSADGTGRAAGFYSPMAVAGDSAGNVYVADGYNYTIRKITPAGVVTTLAGSARQQGTNDGSGSAARFYWPEGIAVDDSGNVYVADSNNNTVRKITPEGLVSTFAGTGGQTGTNDGVGSAARFNWPIGLALDRSGNLYVGDANNHTIRKITPAGVVTTLAGMPRTTGTNDGVGNAARFNEPFGTAVDGQGNVYVADYYNHAIRKITPAGAVTTLAGAAGVIGSNDGPGLLARFNSPTGVAVDSLGTVYVVDSLNYTMRKITPDGMVKTIAGLPGVTGTNDGCGGLARFSYPYGIAVVATSNLVVADTGNHRITLGTPWLPPVITVPPQPQTVFPSNTATFTVTAVGIGPLSFQWAKNGTNLAGQTNAMLTLTNVQAPDAGLYTVLVTNAYGQVSADALLIVALPGCILADSFDPDLDRSQWSVVGGVLATNYGGCVSPPNSLWVGGASRQMVTRALNTLGGGTIFFSLRLANGSAYPWEHVDLPSRGVVLEYSTNGGSAWVEAGRYDTTTFYEWTSVQVQIPPQARAPSTAVRWRQLLVFLTDWDHWALDDVLIVTAPVAPAVVSQPQSQSVLASGTASFSAGASGPEPMFYQWQRNGTNLVDQTNATLVLPGVQPADAGLYSVVVTNLYGAGVSSNATLTVVTVPPSLLTQPQNLALVAGGTAAFSVTVTGTPPVCFLWSRNETLLYAGTNATLLLSNVQPSAAGLYSVVATNLYGRAASSNATLTVYGVPPTVWTQPKSQAAETGWTVRFSVTVAGTEPISYQWRKDGTDLPGETNLALTFVNAQTNDAGLYSVRVTNLYGAAVSASGALSVSASEKPQWAAFNDHYQGPASSPNATCWNVFTNQSGAPGNSGPLKNSADGADLPVTLAITNVGTSGSTAAGAPDPGTPADNTFNGSVDFGDGTLEHSILLGPGAVVAHVFSNLDPARLYRFRGTAAGGSPGETNGWTLCRLEGAASFQAIHSSTNVWTAATPDSTLATNEAAFHSGANNAAGDYIGWDEIVPGSNGVIVVYSQMYSNPLAAAGGPASGFGLIAVQLEEFALRIVSQPQGGRFCAGTPIHLAVGVAGVQPWQFQWCKDGTNLQDATNQSYTIPSLEAGNAGAYWVVAGNGLVTVTSLVAQLVVATNAITIASQPASLFRFSGRPALLAVEVTADSLPVSAQWYYNTASNRETGRPIPAATNLQLGLSSPVPSDTGFYYAMLANCNGLATSAVASLNVVNLEDVQAYAFTNFVGLPGSSGTNNGLGTAARFSRPSALAVDGAGNVYLADRDSHTIRKITPTGEVTTLAGSGGRSGTADGPSGIARFSSPNGLAVDAAGNIFVADCSNHTIRKIYPGGLVTTFAGSPRVSGSADGSGSDARFYFPTAVAVDAAGFVYVTDENNNTIRKITPGGLVSTLAGLAGTTGGNDGLGSAARFYFPDALALDTAGSLYVTEFYNCTIRKITPAGLVTTLAGSANQTGATDGVGAQARFYYPTAIAVDDAGVLFVADYFNNKIRRITPAGVVTTLGGNGSPGGADGMGSGARFYGPHGVVVDGAGTVFVADEANYRVTRGRAWLAPVIGTNPQSQTVAVGNTGVFTVVASGPGPLGFQWRKDQTDLAGQTNATLTLPTVQTNDAGLYSVWITNAYGGVASSNATLTVPWALPAVVVQPQDRTVSAGGTASFSVTVTGVPPASCQWRKGGVDLEGQTNTTLSLVNVQTNDAGAYSVALTNLYGWAVSSNAMLTVLWAPPSFLSQPQDRTVQAGGTASFSVTVTALPPAMCQWRKDGADLPGRTNTTLALANVQTNDAGLYSLALSNAYGWAISSNAALSVLWAAPAILAQPQSQAVAQGSNANFSVIVTGLPPPVCQWRKDGADLTGRTNATLLLTNAQASDAGLYSLWASNRYGWALSSNASLSVSVPVASQWVAYNDHYQGPGSSSHATFWNVFGTNAGAPGNSGPLKNIANGTNLPVILTITNCSVGGAITMSAPTNGTPAYNLFNGYVDFGSGGSGTNHAIFLYPTSVLAHVFTGLDPGQRYNLQGTAARGSPTGTNRWTVCRLEGAVAFRHAHSSTNVWTAAMPGAGLATNEAAFNSGRNMLEGDYVGWEDIVPDSSGVIVVYSKMFTNVPGWTTTAVPYVFGLVALRLEEVPGTSVSLTAQPVGAAVCAGQPVSLTVGVAGPEPWFFQWRKDGTNLSGATNQTYFIPSFGTNEAGDYTVLVRNTFNVVISEAAGVVLSTNWPVILSGPQNQSVLAGSVVTQMIVLAANPSAPSAPSCQWYRNTASNSVTGTSLVGATNRESVLAAATVADSGYYYAVVANCAGAATSRVASLTVAACSNLGVVAWYPLDGDATDLVSGATGTLLGGPVFTNGFVGGGLAFDGADDEVMFPASSALDVGAGGTLSIEAWIKPADVTSRAMVEWSPGPGVTGLHFWLGVYGSGSVFANLIDVNGSSHSWRSDTGLVRTNVWQHVGMSYERSTGLLRFYLNGFKITEYGIGTFTPKTTYPVWLGSRPGDTADKYVGVLDEVSIYNRVLSDAEMLAIFNAGAAGKCRPEQAPTIFTPPQSQAVRAGGTASFSVGVSGSLPLSFQWRKDGTNLAGQVGATLVLSNAQLSDNGLYSVQVTNLYGSAVSSNALLRVGLAGQLVGPAGLTNSFGSLPAASEWSTLNEAGSAADTYDLTNYVQTLAAGSIVTALVDGSSSDPPVNTGLAQWTSAGGAYLYSAPTGNKLTVLLTKLVNFTGTNATRARVAYDLAIKGSGVEAECPGLRAFYSLSGQPNSWVAIPEFSSASPVTGTLAADLLFGSAWADGAGLWLLWADDNGNGLADPGFALDNFSVKVTAGSAVPPPLVITLNAPTNGACYRAGRDIALAAAVTGWPDPTNVEFYANGSWLGASPSRPYAATWVDPKAGAYVLQAVARNTTGSVTSAPVPITVTNLWAGSHTLIAQGDVWKYLDAGTNGPAGWATAVYDDGVWPAGAADLGYGDPTLDTTVRSNRADGTRVVTTYFRRAFTVEDPAAFTYLAARLVRNDGAVVYLNGAEISRRDLPEGLVEFQTLALTNVPAAGESENWALSPALLVAGTNLLAVEMHLSDTNNTELRFAFELQGVVTNAPPSIALTEPAGGVVYMLAGPTNLPLHAAAFDGDGQVAKVEFYVSGEKIGEDAAAPYAAVWSNAFHNGSFYLCAVATDNLGLSATSEVVSVTLFCNVPPSVSLTNPADGAVLFGPTNVVLEAAVFEHGGVVTNLTFYSGANSLGTVVGSPFRLCWSNAPLGYFGLRAVATDDGGLASTSPVVNIAVLDPFIRLTAPGHDSVFFPPTAIQVTAEAAGGSITNVALYANGLWLTATAGTSCVWTWANPAAGEYGLTAVAWDGAGTAHTSAPVRVRVAANNPPGVTLLAPANHTSFYLPASVQLSASASDLDGTVAKVEFFANGSKLGEKLNSPYDLTWSNPAVGGYSLTAVVTDNLGGTNQSAPVIIAVTDARVTRGPYLGCRGPTNMVVRWRTDAARNSQVRYGTDPDNLNLSAGDLAVTTEHAVALTGLQPETRYYYSIGTVAGPIQAGSNYWFWTAPPAGQSRPTRIWFVSDEGYAENGNQALVRSAYWNEARASGGPAQVWMTGGDNDQHSGSDSQYQDNFFSPFTNLLQNHVLFPAVGNHDYGTASTPGPCLFFDVFNLPTRGEAGGLASGNKHFYSHDYGDIHFICLDSIDSTLTAGPGSAMMAWLQQDLAATTQRWIIAYWHGPPYTKGTHDSDDAGDIGHMYQMRNYALPILESYGVDLVLCGHSHVYERTYLISQHYGLSSTFSPAHQVDGGDGREDGTGAYLKTGQAGAVYVTAALGSSPSSGSLNHPAHVVKFGGVAGSCLIDVNSNRLDYQFLSAAGTVEDHFTILKGPSQTRPPGVPANFAAMVNGSSAVLTWANNETNEAGYSLERSLNGADFAPLAAIGANLTACTDPGLAWTNAYYYRLRAWNNAGCSDYSAVASLVPAGALVIDRHPDSVTNQVGGTATFFVLARGTGPLRYQWYHELTSLPGRTNSTLTLVNVQPADLGNYWAMVSNESDAVSTDSAYLAVLSPALPPNVVVPARMANGWFSVGFQGTPGLTYTIQSKDVLDAAWQDRTNLLVPAGGVMPFQEPGGGVPQRFYRAVYPGR
jgi:acid phosphatase type 7